MQDRPEARLDKNKNKKIPLIYAGRKKREDTMKNSIVKMKHTAGYDKNKNILLQSVKVYANKKARTDKFLITKNVIKDLIRSKSTKEFRIKFIKKYGLVDKVNLGSKAFKAGLTSHVRYYALPNKVAKMLGRDNFIVNWEPKLKTKKATKTIKKSRKLVHK